MMNDEHFVVLGVARPRAKWMADIGRWANTSMLPIEFIRCVSVDEVRSRLHSDRRFSALLLGEDCIGVDRDVIEAARDAGCVPIVLTDAVPRRDWRGLGAAEMLTQPVTPEVLLAALRDHAIGVDHRPMLNRADSPLDISTNGYLVAVLGPGGTGTSTTAMAIASHFATQPQYDNDPAKNRVALIDASLNADQALLHDLGDVVPGLQELVDLHRTTNPTNDDVRNFFWFSPRHGYDVLPGLRRHRDWSTLRRRTTLAALTSIHRSFDFIVADTDCDFEGESETGSIDVEDRNLLSRELAGNADLVVLTARAGTSGLSRTLRVLRDLVELGIETERILLVILGAPRSTRHRSELSRSVLRLFDEAFPSHALSTPVMVPIRRDLEPFIHDGSPPPRSALGSITAAVSERLLQLDPKNSRPMFHATPIAIIPGHLGRTA
jgi:cellulose biosynthesis protein BcsQ